jgi:hypothetical protein
MNAAHPDATPYRPFPTFAFVWGVTTLVHQLAFTFWTETWPGWVLVVAAVALIHRPDCLLRFGALVVASLLHLWEKMPFVPNHILYEGMLHLILLLGLVGFLLTRIGRSEVARNAAAWKARLPLALYAVAAKAAYFLVPGVPQGYLLGALTTVFLAYALGRFLNAPAAVGLGETYLARVAPVMRTAVVAMYVWAVVQKLNWDYFNPEVSCAAKLHVEIASYFGGLVPTAPWTLVTAAVGSLVFELGIPILLCIRRTRYVGFVAAVFFHLWLSIHPAAGIYSFTSLILAILLLFLPLEWGQQLQNLWDAQLRRLGGGDLAKGRHRARRLVVGIFFAVLIAQGALYLILGRNYEVFGIANRVGFFAFFAWGCWLGGCYLAAGWRAGRSSGGLVGRPVPTLAWIGLVPVLLNGLWPWIGGRTQTSFSMYSNLRSEAAGNHMFIKRVDLLGMQNDFVEVLVSAPNLLDPDGRPRGIAQFAHPGHRVLPWFEFRRLVSEHEGDFEVGYRRGSDELTLGRKEGVIFGDPEAFEPLPLWQRKLLWFRRLETLEGPMCCTH